MTLTDSTGLLVAFSSPISGKHHDTYQVNQVLDEMEKQLADKQISMRGLFMNVDDRFDNKAFTQACILKGIILNYPLNKRKTKDFEDHRNWFDPIMYQQRFVVERTNAWMDNEKNLLVRQDTSVLS